MLTRRSAVQGANRIRFTGRVGRKVKLAPGRYRITTKATDAAGNRSGEANALPRRPPLGRPR